MENVLTGEELSSAISATTELESMPPLRNAPSGTSAISRRRTASLKRLPNCSIASGSDRLAFWEKRTCQYGSTVKWPACHTRRWPGGSFFKLRYAVVGAGTYRYVR